MKVGKSEGMPEQIGFDMTPMIDCCFQLIIFFMLSLRLFSAEGDFNIKMPLTAPSESRPDDTQLPPIKVRMKANADGSLSGVQMGARTLGGRPFDELRLQIRDIVGDARGPGSVREKTEVELECDFNLRYEYVIRAITAVSGYMDNGQIVKLVEKIKFTPPKKGGG